MANTSSGYLYKQIREEDTILDAEWLQKKSESRKKEYEFIERSKSVSVSYRFAKYYWQYILSDIHNFDEQLKQIALELLTTYPIVRQYRLYNVFFSDLHSKFDYLDIGFITLFFGNEPAWPKTINIIANSADGKAWLKNHFDTIIRYLSEHESLARIRQRIDDILLTQNYSKKEHTSFLKHTFKESYSAIHYLLSHYPQNLNDISEQQKWAYLFSIEQYESFLDYPFFREILSSPTLLHQLVGYRLSGQHALGAYEKQQTQKIILIAQGYGNLNNVASQKTSDSTHEITLRCEHNVLETAISQARNIHKIWLTDFLILWIAAGGKPRLKFGIPGIPEMELEIYLHWTQTKFLLPYIKEFRMREIIKENLPQENIKKIKKI